VGLAPPYVPSTREISRSPGRAGTTGPYRSTSGALRGVPSLTLFLRPLPVPTTPRTMSRGATPAGHLSGAPLHATRQAAGVPSARSQTSPSPSRGRADGASLGRPRHEPRRTRRPAPPDATLRGSSPACDGVPLSLGRATPPATRLMGRRDARPHNTRHNVGAPGRHHTRTAISDSEQVRLPPSAVRSRRRPRSRRRQGTRRHRRRRRTDPERSPIRTRPS